MTCNIDAKGKAVRLISGLIHLAAAVILIVLWLTGVLVSPWALGIGVVLVLCGGFQIYEAWAGWCVVRAMGFKTRM